MGGHGSTKIRLGKREFANGSPFPAMVSYTFPGYLYRSA